MGIHLREKKLEKGYVSFYLDIYHNKTRWYEFLEIKINKKHPTEQDKEKKRLAQEIRSKRESELIVQGNGLIDRNKRKADFVAWYKKWLVVKHRSHNCNTTLLHLETYLEKRPLPFSAITPAWLKTFTNYVLVKVSNNSARIYVMNIYKALEDAIVEEVIESNPFRRIPRHERLRHKDTFRKAYSLEELAQLINTPCKIDPQYQQAYIFSCFTGLRWSDVNCLRWKEIVKRKVEKEERYFMYFEQEKTEGVEYLPMSEQAVEIIKQRERERADEPLSPFVFPRVKEENAKTKRTYTRVSSALRKWARLAGLDETEMTFHTARHSFATNVLEHSEDGDLWTVSKLLGHNSITSTQIYAHVRDKKKADAVKALPKLNLKVAS